MNKERRKEIENELSISGFGGGVGENEIRKSENIISDIREAVKSDENHKNA